ncbi:VanZ family protein [Peribacillus sp. NPDC096379]|uniref:VanZ family protein n=1 Tax=Peribacillus sp. NPDC096379 TaxID=3364393 RepID=UPI0037F1D5EE
MYSAIILNNLTLAKNCREKFSRCISLFSIKYEIFKLIFKFGSFDIDDLILNTLGGILGYLPIKLCQLYINSKRKHLKNNVFSR